MMDFETMKIILNGMEFSKNVAEKLIGSRRRMNYLIDNGRIRTKRQGTKENAKYFLNALDVMKYASI